MSTLSPVDLLSPQMLAVEARMRSVVDGAGADGLRTMLLYHLGFTDARGRSERAPAGKRIRPALLLLAASVSGQPGSVEAATSAAAAVELLHNFSLIHDDIEDGDTLRRGRPTLWNVWGIAQSINTGDAMFAMAHQALLESAAPAERVLRAMNVFETMCVRLTRGQHLDISFETRADVSVAEYLEMIAGKTAALTEACCEIGAILGGSDNPQILALARFGRDLGVAFQIQDDALGIWGDPARTGKADTDLVHRKKTYPVLVAAERDPVFQARYFDDGAEKRDLASLREMIEATGAREATEAAATATYDRGLESLAGCGGVPAAVEMLSALAHSLFARAA
ncbi:MAG: polyprenyl synthetase family protein [Thermoflexales bacterium]